jgi:putative Ig domain-containing protein/FG-GAP repeat protein
MGSRGRLALAVVAALTLAAPARAALPQQAGTVDLLTQANVRIDGPGANAGASYGIAAAGDVNGDGIGDVLVGVPVAPAGSAYVVFGQPSPTGVDLAALGAQGFRIDGAAANDAAGTAAAAAGDVNGDGLADVIVGAPVAGNNARAGSGSAYIVFGRRSTAPVALGALGAGGFRIDGAAANDAAGSSVAGAGDVNGDGLADVIVGAPGADNNARAGSGSAYAVFGKASSGAVDLAALGGGGFRLDGGAAADAAGSSVAGAGDVNGDGRSDVIVGAPLVDLGLAADEGRAYVVFGKSSPDPEDLSMLENGGFVIYGAAAGDNAGESVAGVGDVNRDGRPDVAVGAIFADANGRTDAGAAFVVFGKQSASMIDLAALGPAGYRIDGAAPGDIAGKAVAGVGDVNGDGVPDVAVGAPDASAQGRAQSGAAYVVFGKASTGTTDLASLGASGIRIDGAAAADNAGYRLAGGDVNGDGRSDVLVGALNASPRGRAFAGSAFGVLGFGTPALAYGAGVVGVVGKPIAALRPSAVARTGPALFSVSPALPAGLTLDPATGAVSGTPTRAQATTPHTVTMTDLAGSASAALSVTIARDTTRPTVSGFGFSPRAFAVSAKRTATTAAVHRGTTIRYALSEPATVVITIARELAGRRSGKRCVRPTRKLAHKRRCTRFVTAGKLTRRGQAAGRRTLAFSGRMGRRALKPGRYRATIVATDPSRNTGRRKTATFTIVRPRKR